MNASIAEIKRSSRFERDPHNNILKHIKLCAMDIYQINMCLLISPKFI